MTRATVISVSHGGGPMPLLGDPSHAALTASMQKAAPAALRLNTPAAPRAIVVVTAHWETDVVTVSSGARPPLLYDYYGFPAESYALRYDAPGAPDVAAEIAALLDAAGIAHALDAERGWDHGVFVPLLLMHPAADVPVVQVSVLASQDPAQLFAVGRALAPLREANVAVVGSGMAGFHNFRLLRGGATPAALGKVKAQHAAWLKDMKDAAEEESVARRGEQFGKWREWTGAWDAHPRGQAEHFSPLVVCAGAAGDGKAKSWVDNAMGWDLSTFYWDD